MSIQDYNSAVEFLQQNQELSDFVGQCSEQLIKKAEGELNITFPQTYRKFLLDYGAGNFGSEEIYGIVKDDFDNSGIPDAIWYTLKQRREANLPSNLVIIYYAGGEEMFCLDINKLGKYEESVVVSYLIGVDLEYQTYEIIADDFGEFLLQRVKSELGISQRAQLKLCKPPQPDRIKVVEVVSNGKERKELFWQLLEERGIKDLDGYRQQFFAHFTCLVCKLSDLQGVNLPALQMRHARVGNSAQCEPSIRRLLN